MNRIKELREALGMSLQDVANEVGTTKPTIHKLETGARKLTEDWMRRLAPALQVRPADIMSDPIPVPDDPRGAAPLMGIAAAGSWIEVDLNQDTGEMQNEPSAFAFDDRFKGMQQYALKVEGPSLNRRVAHGKQVLCVALADIGIEPKTGQYYHVMQYRDGGQLREATIKRLVLDNGKAELWPDSDDPKFQEPLKLGVKENGDEVVLVGLVIKFEVDAPI